MALLRDKIEAGPPLDIGQLISTSLVVFSNNVFILTAITIAGGLSEFLLDGFAFGFDVAAWRSEDIHNPPGFSASSVAMDLLQSAIYGLLAGLVIQIVCNSRSDHDKAPRLKLDVAGRAVVPSILFSSAIIALSYLGILAMLIAVFWIFVVFFVVLPAAVIERSGYNAWNRSLTLTKYYRWPIFVIVGIPAGMVFLFWFLLDIVSATVEPTLSHSTVGTLSIGALDYLLSGAVTMVHIILGSVTYFHLVEIKEGPSVDKVAEVFE